MPNWLLHALQVAEIGYQFFIDYLRYVRTSSPMMPRIAKSEFKRDHLEAELTILYHSLEKGSALPERRRPFGLEKAKAIADNIQDARRLGVSDGCIDSAISARVDVAQFNAGGEVRDVSCSLKPVQMPDFDFSRYKSFVESRHSVRHFDSSRSLAREQIESAVELAALSPSVCNRRGFRAYYLETPDAVHTALRLQDGNTGFGGQVPAVLVVTVRRGFFIGAKERNQGWIDGGLFAMNLLWALHAQGLATCFLNWAERNARTDALRAVVGIPAEEDVIVMIATGYADRHARATRSPRRAVDEVLRTSS